jgi:response regulator of citrate/malate metabolism
MTANDVYEAALALMDEIDDDSTVNEEATASYAGKAPRLLDLLQRELAKLEGVEVTAKIDTLDDEMEISDDSAMRVMPYGLAAQFASADENYGKADRFQGKYEQLQRTIGVVETGITDEYEILSGMGTATDEF